MAGASINELMIVSIRPNCLSIISIFEVNYFLWSLFLLKHKCMILSEFSIFLPSLIELKDYIKYFYIIFLKYKSPAKVAKASMAALIT